MIFEQKNVEVPKDWSMTATNIVASKYLHGQIGTDERETGVRQLVTRVAETIRDWGMKDGYFRTAEDAATFHDELVHLLVRQHVAFNSPVWFNVGCERIEPKSDATNWHWNFPTQQVEFGVTGYTRPQCSACFINSVKDSLDSILTLAKTEGMLFKWGSGTGTNLSPLRSSTEVLRRRHRQRPAQLHERLRRLRRRHQERRQDAPRRQDGHPEHRPSRHR
jgi:ribonucleoside-diphosphate reductase alpha chain